MSAHGNEDHETVRGMAPGFLMELEGFGSYQIVRPLRIGKGADLYVARVVRHPTHEDVILPPSVVLKLHKGDPGPAIAYLPDDTLIMKPLVRAKVGWRVVDVLTEASTDLHRWWSSRGITPSQRRLEPDVVLTLAIPMAAGVALAHSDQDKVGVIHGDIKLGQYLLSDLGVRLSDWDGSVVRSQKPDGPREDEFETSSIPATAATYAYLPPWGHPGRTSVRYDTWALLVCWHQLLAGRHPAEVYADRPFKNQLPIFDAVSKGQWRIDDSLDPWWTDFLNRHMHAAPDSRATAAELTSELVQHAATLMRIRFPPNGLTSHGPLVMAPLNTQDVLAVSIDRAGRVSSRMHHKDDDSVEMFVALARMADRAGHLDDLCQHLKSEREQERATLLSDLRTYQQTISGDAEGPPWSDDDVREGLLAVLTEAYERLQQARVELAAATAASEASRTDTDRPTEATGQTAVPPAGWRCSECGSVDDGGSHDLCGERESLAQEPGGDAATNIGAGSVATQWAAVHSAEPAPSWSWRKEGIRTAVLTMVGVLVATASLSVLEILPRPKVGASLADVPPSEGSTLTASTGDDNVVAPPADVARYVLELDTLEVDELRQAKFSPLAFRRVAGRVVVSATLLGVDGTGAPDKVSWACGRPTPRIDGEKQIAAGVYLLVDGPMASQYFPEAPDSWGFRGASEVFERSDFFALAAACGTGLPDEPLATTWPAVALSDDSWSGRSDRPRVAEFLLPGPRTRQSEPISRRARPMYGILLVTEARRMIFSSEAFRAAATQDSTFQGLQP